ncbi:NAD(P)H-hydrate dehydratase [Patescibacteria group bacterium]|nr:NAD(P)H-hydrate dehydratase [Patescibacteria group bacterium]
MKIPTLKKSDVKKLFPRRQKNSHKGMNGKIMIVGGSIDYYGAPLLATLGAYKTGVDLVYTFVPDCNFDVSRSYYPDFIVRKFHGNYLAEDAVTDIVEFSKKCDVLLIGPGIGERAGTLRAIQMILERVNIPTILDSSAIHVLTKITRVPLPQPVIITPHANEFEMLTGKDLQNEDPIKKNQILHTVAKDLHINIVLKGEHDFITSDDGETVVNATGNAGMTVGGTGDVLAGMIASFIAQGARPFDACKMACFFCGAAADTLSKEKGYNYLASEVALNLPDTIANA